MVHTRREEEPHPSVPVRNWDVLGLVTTMAQCLVLQDTTPSQCVWKRMDGGKRVSLTKAHMPRRRTHGRRRTRKVIRLLHCNKENEIIRKGGREGKIPRFGSR
jgi:hypothetical protein